jgi:hypothetical protein
MGSTRASPAAFAVMVSETIGGLAEDDERDPEQGERLDLEGRELRMADQEEWKRHAQ